MSRMKTFFKYFLAIVIVYIIVDIAAVYTLKSTYLTKDYSVENSILDVEVGESKATFVNGYIKGIIKNNTEGKTENKYLKMDVYSKRNVLLGTKYLKINDLNSGEAMPFEASFNYEQIDHTNISIIDAAELPPEKNLDFGFDNPEDAKVTWAVLFGAFLILVQNGFTWVLLP